MQIPKPTKTASGYRIQLRLGGQSVVVKAEDKRSCVKKAEQIKANWQIDRQAIVAPSRDRIGDMMDGYIAAKESTLSPLTVRGYKTISEYRWRSVALRRAADISPQEWQRVVSREAKLCSPKTLKNAWGFLCSAARFYGHVLPPVKLPMLEPKQRDYLTPDQIPTFVQTVAPTRFAVPLLLALSSLRISEIDALRWEDIPENPASVTTSGAVVLNKDNKYHRKATGKNAASSRTVPLMIPELKAAIERDRKASGPLMPCSQNTLRANCKKLCEQAGLPPVSVHGLRHSFASLCYHLRVPERIVMEIGGWSNERTVHDIYTHIAQSDVAHYGTLLSDFFAPKPAEATDKTKKEEAAQPPAAAPSERSDNKLA